MFDFQPKCSENEPFRNSRLDLLYEKGILRNFANLTVKHLYRSLFLVKVEDCTTTNFLLKRDSVIAQNTFLAEYFRKIVYKV